MVNCNNYPKTRGGYLDYLEVIALCQQFKIPEIYLDSLSILDFRGLLTKSIKWYKVNMENKRTLTELAIYNTFSAKTAEERKVLYPELYPDKKPSEPVVKQSEEYIKNQKQMLKDKFNY